MIVDGIVIIMLQLFTSKFMPTTDVYPKGSQHTLKACAVRSATENIWTSQLETE
jgi:hypothetical protein